MALEAEKQAMELKVQNMRRQEQEATNNGYGITMGKRLMDNKWYHKQGLHLTAKIQDRGYGLGSLRLKPRFETELELYFILRSPKPHGLVWSSDRFNRGLV